VHADLRGRLPSLLRLAERLVHQAGRRGRRQGQRLGQGVRGSAGHRQTAQRHPGALQAMQVIRPLLIALCAIVFAASASAQIQQARGKATVTYAKAKAAPADVKARALHDAQLKAVDAYYAEAGESESANYEALRPKIADNPDRYFLDTTVLAEEDNPGAGQYTVTVRVSMN